MHGERGQKELQNTKMAGKHKKNNPSLTMRCVGLCVTGLGGNTLELRSLRRRRLRKHQWMYRRKQFCYSEGDGWGFPSRIPHCFQDCAQKIILPLGFYEIYVDQYSGMQPQNVLSLVLRSPQSSDLKGHLRAIRGLRTLGVLFIFLKICALFKKCWEGSRQ